MVTTPIGNLDDFTKRANVTLDNTRVIASEDTRVTKILLKNLGINFDDKRIESFHDHSGKSKLDLFLKILKTEDVVIVSDAGSPYISDPSYPLVKAAIDNDIKVETRPGVCSVVAALELSGLPATPFYFHGFLPRKEGKKIENFEFYSSLKGTHIFFEAVHRIEETLLTLSKVFTDSEIAICRELTKEYETVQRGNTKDIDSLLADLIKKGEFVICIHNTTENVNSGKVTRLANEVIESGGKPKSVAKLLGEILNQDSKVLYGKLSRK